MHQTITLNIGPTLSDEQWEQISEVYRGMDGWIDGSPMPCWYGTAADPSHILVSAEPNGLVFEGKVEPHVWVGWITVICARLTLALGVPVHDADM